MKKVFEPVTDTIKNTSENLTKTKTEPSKQNNKAPENLELHTSRVNERKRYIWSVFYLKSPILKILVNSK